MSREKKHTHTRTHGKDRRRNMGDAVSCRKNRRIKFFIKELEKYLKEKFDKSIWQKWRIVFFFSKSAEIRPGRFARKTFRNYFRIFSVKIFVWFLSSKNFCSDFSYNLSHRQQFCRCLYSNKRATFLFPNVKRIIFHMRPIPRRPSFVWDLSSKGAGGL